MTGNRFIAETLAGYGVSHVFFMPAGTYNILAEMEGLGIQRILVHSEKAAAYMADGYARASGRPGVCMSQAAPGANNLAAGLGDPYCGVSPVIAITSARSARERYRHAYQELDQMPFFDPVTKFNAMVDRLDRIPDLLRQAFRSATTGSPRPAHLDIHTEAANQEGDLDVVIERPFTRYPAFRPEPEMDRVREAARVLMEAQRPVIVAGGGVISSEAWDEVVQLAEALSIPVATSLNGKGAIPGPHLPYSHALPDGRYGAAELVSQYGAGLQHVVLEAVHVGAAYGAVLDPDLHLPPTRDWRGHIHDLQPLPICIDNRLHGGTSVNARRSQDTSALGFYHTRSFTAPVQQHSWRCVLTNRRLANTITS
jgi:thiamine pyrophosphate-dependent acetolactate synthase large subunit-like protein